MKFYDIVTKIASESGLSQDRLSLKIGRSISYISASKGRGSIPKVDNAAMIVDACGYTLCVVPSDNVPEDAITIDF